MRELERQIGAVCRAVAAELRAARRNIVQVTPAFVTETFGPPRYVREKALTTGAPGVVTGLAYTPSGGEILHIEATRFPAEGTSR